MKNYGDDNTLGNWNTLGDCNTLGDWNTLGDRNKLGDRNTLGDDNKLGDDNTLGDCNKLGDGFKFGDRLTMESVKVIALMCMSNVDGSGRKITIIVHTEGIKVRAGCFAGSLDEFCDRALSEGKKRYARVVRAAAETLADVVSEEGIDGGWSDQS